jgi:transcriptional regulator with XRE-family HTH domain
VSAGRRRTPGLRREELAAKTGVSTIRCAWIEQGRKLLASSKALVKLAALALTASARETLFERASRSDPQPDA